MSDYHITIVCGWVCRIVIDGIVLFHAMLIQLIVKREGISSAERRKKGVESILMITRDSRIIAISFNR